MVRETEEKEKTLEQKSDEFVCLLSELILTSRTLNIEMPDGMPHNCKVSVGNGMSPLPIKELHLHIIAGEQPTLDIEYYPELRD